MLLAVGDRWLDPEAVERVMDGVLEGMAGTAPGAALATSPAEVDQASAAGRPTVLLMRDDEPEIRLESAVASAAAVLWITTADSSDVRSLLRLDTGSRRATPIVSVVVADDLPDRERLRRQRVISLWIPPEPTRRDLRRLHRLGRRLAWTAVAPRRLDPLDRETHLWAASQAAQTRLADLLEETGVEEFQIRGGECMIVHRAEGQRERRNSPFASNEELIETARHLASFSGGQPQRFDVLDSRLDIRLGDRWRLHAEAFMCHPPTMVLRSNMAGKATLDDLSVAAAPLQKILIGAVSGPVRANIVIAAAMGGGKTTLCQALLATVDGSERIDTIEDTPELRLAQYGIHSNSYERLTRDANNDGVGKLAMSDHIRDAKRANSSKLVIGETRGEGTLALLDAMSSGLSGCLVTLHSQPGAGVLAKLLSYACSEGADPRFARQQIAIAVQLLVWMGRNELGERVISDVSQIVNYDERHDTIETRCLWSLSPGQRWAAPAGLPHGQIERLYQSAGINLR
ncbi:MAG: ATPase, T2SS/T4P/T4SS family [bacterium]|nr:ATPase, T2SS/T4P/T4SS family [bacterium]MCY3889688.1 ATPase, T2SS/T4P/T4SS family [bacterium]MCY3963015.1 ATPase, T2SS/T4P/T4SS family [bacterium]